MEKRSRVWGHVLSAIATLSWFAFLWTRLDGQVSRLAFWLITLALLAAGLAHFITWSSERRELKQAKNDSLSWQNSYTRSLLFCISALRDGAAGELMPDEAEVLRNMSFRDLVAALNEGAYLNKGISNKQREALKQLVVEAHKKGWLEYPSKAHRQLYDLLDLDE
ncbi:MAG: hypothetical protein WC641_06805 [Patescibacteria group bacterium]